MNEVALIKKEVKQFLSDNQIRYEAFAKFQSSIDELTEESYQETVQLIQDNIDILFKDHPNAIFFLVNIIRTSEYHFKKLELYLDIILHFSNEFKKLNVTENEMLSICYHYPNTINYLYSKNFFTIESIIEQSVHCIFLFANFLPEIEKFDPEYASIIETKIAPNKFANNERYLQLYKFVKSNPEKHQIYRNLNYHPSSLHKSIRNDDIATFQSILSKNNYGINYVIEFSFYERALTVDYNLSLIQIAAVYGSLKIFKFLLMQDEIKINENLLNYAYFGYNIEIIHLCENKCSIKGVYIQPIRIHQTDFLNYFIENFGDQIEEDKIVQNQLINYNKENEEEEDEEEEDNLYNCLNYESLSAAVFSFNFPIIKRFLPKIVFISKKIELANDSLFLKNESFLFNSDYDYILFKFLYSHKKSIENKIVALKFRDILEELLFDAANDSFKFMFHDIKNDIDLALIFRYCIDYNQDLANFILDLQFEEKEIKNQEPYVFNELKKIIVLDDLYDAITCYNEDVVFKMIKLYDFLNSKENIENVAKKLKDFISSRMISSLYKRLCSLLSQEDLAFFATFFEFL